MPHRQNTRRRRITRSLATASTIGVIVLTPATAHAAGTGATLLAADTIDQVIDNIQVWLAGILIATATLFLTIGGLRYLAAGGDPGEAEKAKLALRSAALGYALALMAPLIVTIVSNWVK